MFSKLVEYGNIGSMGILVLAILFIGVGINTFVKGYNNKMVYCRIDRYKMYSRYNACMADAKRNIKAGAATTMLGGMLAGIGAILLGVTYVVGKLSGNSLRRSWS
jgi:hypothetical protein